MDAPSSQHSSSFSSTPNSSSTRAQRRGSRTTNACEACKKRKTKCSGPRGPCEACRKVETFCHFNARLDTRRKLAYKPAAVQERQQYILHGLLHILKFGDDGELLQLINLIRREALPQDIAGCLRRNIQSLQDRGILPSLNVDETDLMSLGLQGLYSHRAGRAGLKQSSCRTSSNPMATLTGPQEIRLRPQRIDGKPTSTPSSSCSRPGSQLGTHGDLLAFNNEPSLTKHPCPLDPASVPGDNRSQSSSANVTSSFTTMSPSPHIQYAVKNETDLTNVMLHHSHTLHSARHSEQLPSDGYATGTIAPNSTLSMDSGHSSYADRQNFQSTSSGENLTTGFRDDEAGMAANVLARKQMNDIQQIEYELAIGHGMPHYEWNIPNWVCEASALPQTF